MREIENAFSATSSLLLGAPLTGIRDYSSWLLMHVKGRVIERRSRISGKIVYVSSVPYFQKLGDNVVTHEEGIRLGKERKLTLAEAESLTLKNASRDLSGIKTTSPEIIFDKNIGTKECTCYGPTQYCFQGTMNWYCKNAAYSYWPKRSENVYGSGMVYGCKFCIKVHSSTNLTRCFEVTDSHSCSDTYFSHNCENLQECMFCFNTKGKRYAIANREVGKEKYMEIKKRILKQVYEELSTTKTLKYDIYTLGA